MSHVRCGDDGEGLSDAMLTHHLSYQMCSSNSRFASGSFLNQAISHAQVLPTHHAAKAVLELCLEREPSARWQVVLTAAPRPDNQQTTSPGAVKSDDS